MRQPGLLVVTAHPDDETLIAGGVLAAASAAGVPTAVACLTRGELGRLRDRRLLNGRTLAATRRDELHDACARLGVGSVHCFARADGYLPFVRRSAIVAQLARTIAAHAPAAVVTFGEDGLYHHPDHIAVHEYTLAALRQLWREPRGTSPGPVLYEAVWPSRVTVSAARALARLGRPGELWGIAPEDFGVDELAGAVRMDVRPFAATKQQALRCHRTQVGPRHLLAGLPPGLATRYLGYEWFRPRAPARADRGCLAGMIGPAVAGA